LFKQDGRKYSVVKVKVKFRKEESTWRRRGGKCTTAISLLRVVVGFSLCQSITFLAYMAHFFPIFFAISTLK